MDNYYADLIGGNMSAKEIKAQADEAGQTVEQWFREVHAELWQDTPDWWKLTDEQYSECARQIEREAAQS